MNYTKREVYILLHAALKGMEWVAPLDISGSKDISEYLISLDMSEEEVKFALENYDESHERLEELLNVFDIKYSLPTYPPEKINGYEVTLEYQMDYFMPWFESKIIQIRKSFKWKVF